jgi:predicted MPP superfamily phosphohydrolase
MVSVHLAGIARRLAPSLRVSRLDVAIPSLPEELDGCRIAHISDLHVGSHQWLPLHLDEVAATLREFDPDVVVNTGDYLQEDPPLAKVGAIAARLVIPSPPGLDGPANIAVLGNHDYYAGEEKVTDLKRLLGDLGIRVLINEQLELLFRERPLTIAGLNGQEPGLEETVVRLAKASPPRIVLVHEPELAQRLPPRSAELVLAGHTHGGQIRIPLLTNLIVRRFAGSNYAESRYLVNENPIYVNHGLGNTGLPFRFRARPEVTLFRLAR